MQISCPCVDVIADQTKAELRQLLTNEREVHKHEIDLTSLSEYMSVPHATKIYIHYLVHRRCLHHSYDLDIAALRGASDGARRSVTSLMQTNCLLLTPLLLQSEGRGGKNFPYVHIMEHLNQQGYACTFNNFTPSNEFHNVHFLIASVARFISRFMTVGGVVKGWCCGYFIGRFVVVGARMVWLTSSQAQHFLHLMETGNFQLVSSSNHFY